MFSGPFHSTQNGFTIFRTFTQKLKLLKGLKPSSYKLDIFSAIFVHQHASSFAQSTEGSSLPNLTKKTKLMDGGDESDSNGFKCNICYEPAEQDPVVTPCGHLYCWPCLYTWLHRTPRASNRCPCPVCKVVIEQSRLIPLYGIGRSNGSDPRLSVPSIEIPNRPAAPRFTARPASTASIFVKLFCRLLIRLGQHILVTRIEIASDNFVESVNRRFHGSIEAAEVRGNNNGEGSSNHNELRDGVEVSDNNGDGSSMTSVLDNEELHELLVLEQSSDW